MDIVDTEGVTTSDGKGGTDRESLKPDASKDDRKGDDRTPSESVEEETSLSGAHQAEKDDGEGTRTRDKEDEVTKDGSSEMDNEEDVDDDDVEEEEEKVGEEEKRKECTEEEKLEEEKSEVSTRKRKHPSSDSGKVSTSFFFLLKWKTANLYYFYWPLLYREYKE